MAEITSQSKLANLNINEVPSEAVFRQMLEDGQVNENELYLVIGAAAYEKTFAVSDWAQQAGGYAISVPAQTHGHGASFYADVWMQSGSAYQKTGGYPGTGWTLETDASGNVTLRVASAEARFAGKLVIV